MSNENRMLAMLPDLAKTFSTPIHFVELGANDGYHTQLMVSFLNQTGRPWKYVSVEPDPRLSLHVPAGVQLFRGAVGAYDGPGKLHLSSGQSDTGMHYSGSSSLRPPTDLIFENWPRMRFDTAAQVQVMTLDSLCAQFGLDWIDFIWCDIQGCEGDVIQGAPKMMPKTKWFFTEYSAGKLYAGQATFSELPGMLPNFDLYLDMQGDALFANKALQTGTSHTASPPP